MILHFPYLLEIREKVDLGEDAQADYIFFLSVLSLLWQRLIRKNQAENAAHISAFYKFVA